MPWEHVPSFIRISDTHPFGEQAKFENPHIVFQSQREGRPTGRKTPVEAIDEFGAVTMRFNSHTEAARNVGCQKQSIARAIADGYKCKGYHWRKACT